LQDFEEILKVLTGFEDSERHNMTTLRVIYVAVLYTLIFTGYYFIAGFLNIVYPNEAFISFAIFYGAYAVSSLIAPFIIARFGHKIPLIVSSLSFLAFIASASSSIVYLMLIGSGICGIGNSVIWIVQGVYLSDKSELIGTFYGIFSLNLIVGNLIALIVLLTSAWIRQIMWIMMIPTGIGVVMSFFAIFDGKVGTSPDTSSSLSLFQSLRDVFTTPFRSKSKRLGYLLILTMAYQAISLNVTYQILPKRVVVSAHNDTHLASIYSSIMYVAYGVSAAISSFIWGKLYDRFGWRSNAIPYLILEVGCLTGIVLLGHFSGPTGIWILVGFVRGIIDYGVNNILNSIISNEYAPETGSTNKCAPETGSPNKCSDKMERSNIFGFYRFVYASLYAIFSICSGYMSYEWFVLMCGILCVLSVLTLILFFRIEKDIKISDVKGNGPDTQPRIEV
jgi:MFS family permease